jgi:glycerate dehydrogenase
MKKIVVLDGYTENPGDLSWDQLAELGDLTVYDHTPAEEIDTRIGDAEIVYTNKTPLNAQTLENHPKLEFIGVLATGYNVVDVVAAKAHGIVVCNVPTYGTTAVAQYVFALLLEVCHHVAHHSDAVKQGRWSNCRDFCFWDYPLIELKGKTMGIVGYGRIGRATADIARAFGMKVLAYDVHGEGEEMTTLENLLANSDVVSLHCPLFKENTGMINRETIAGMKDGAILINTSRGPLINETDLREALLSGKIMAAAVDVLSVEPARMDNPLMDLPNCIITPHIAWANKESRQRLMDVAVGNLREYLAGNTINNVAK